MSTRYVWDRSVAKVDYEVNISDESAIFYVSHSSLQCGESYDVVGGKFTLTGKKASITTGDSNIAGISTQAISYRYVLYGSKLIFFAKTPRSDDLWHLRNRVDSVSDNNKYKLTISPGIYDDDLSAIQLLGIKENGYIKGDFIDKKSSTLSSTYPHEGVSSDGWYSYLGADIIDPNAIRYPSSSPNPGSSVTISVTPRSPTYGGTINYQFSYSINGGSTWTNIGSATTATSKTVTIPSHATQFRARVIASDTWGFTSTTYVYGDNVSLNGAPTTPGSVNIPATVYPGESFSVSWGASTDPDGNLSGYEVQKVYDGGSGWTSVKASTTAVSISDTVAEGYTSVQYRVRAKDTLGLTSGWAYSNTTTIQNMRVYVGVAGKARKVTKIYVGVNGKAREVVKGYIGVGGVARRFL